MLSTNQSIESVQILKDEEYAVKTVFDGFGVRTLVDGKSIYPLELNEAVQEQESQLLSEVLEAEAISQTTSWLQSQWNHATL